MVRKLLFSFILCLKVLIVCSQVGHYGRKTVFHLTPAFNYLFQGDPTYLTREGRFIFLLPLSAERIVADRFSIGVTFQSLSEEIDVFSSDIYRYFNGISRSEFQNIRSVGRAYWIDNKFYLNDYAPYGMYLGVSVGYLHGSVNDDFSISFTRTNGQIVSEKYKDFIDRMQLDDVRRRGVLLAGFSFGMHRPMSRRILLGLMWAANILTYTISKNTYAQLDVDDRTRLTGDLFNELDLFARINNLNKINFRMGIQLSICL